MIYTRGNRRKPKEGALHDTQPRGTGCLLVSALIAGPNARDAASHHFSSSPGLTDFVEVQPPHPGARDGALGDKATHSSTADLAVQDQSISRFAVAESLEGAPRMKYGILHILPPLNRLFDIRGVPDTSFELGLVREARSSRQGASVS